MTDVVTLAGGDPTPSTTLVTCDQLTVTGDGSLANPLRSVPTEGVFRPYSLIPSHGNVFTTWDEVMAWLAATATLGVRDLYFDFLGSPTSGPPPYGSPSWMMPDGTWDMRNVTWKDIPNNSGLFGVGGFDGGNTLFFGNDCHVKNLSKIDGSSLIIMNTSTTNVPIELDAGCAKMHLSGFVMFGNDATYGDNPNVKPVVKFNVVDADNEFYQIYSDSPQAMFGLYGQGPWTFTDTNTPPPPVLDIGGAYCFLRVQFNTKAVTSTVIGAFAVVERVSDDIACGFGVQSWEFDNAANITVFCANMTRVSYWIDNNNNDDPNSKLGFAVIAAAEYTSLERSGQYQPYPPADATHYLAIHNQVCFCDPTLDGDVELTIELPTATIANGEVIKIVDVIGNAAVESPINIRAKAGETIINGAAPAATTRITTAYGRIELICNGLGQWVAV